MITLADLQGKTEAQIKQHIAQEYRNEQTTEFDQQDPEITKALKGKKVLIAYESVGSWGCDSSSFFLLQDKKTKELFMQIGSHCSCYGFENQFMLEPTNVEYLKSDKFYVSTGGYDGEADKNEAAIKEFVSTLPDQPDKSE